MADDLEVSVRAAWPLAAWLEHAADPTSDATLGERVLAEAFENLRADHIDAFDQRARAELAEKRLSAAEARFASVSKALGRLRARIGELGVDHSNVQLNAVQYEDTALVGHDNSPGWDR